MVSSRHIVFALGCAALAASAAVAQTSVRAPLRATSDRMTVLAARATRAPVIDGRFDDPAWTGAQIVSGFTQQAPNAGSPATQATDVRIVTDADAIYVAMRMHDSAPDSVVGTLARRDYIGYSDWAQVVIDSYWDRRTAFRFAVNPAGVKRDGFISGDAEWTEDLAWDAVWDAVARRDSAGWTAEIRIPLSQLRFSTRRTGDAAVWGIQFVREVARRGERTLWVPIEPNAGTFVSLFGTLAGVPVSEARRRLEITPYGVASSRLAGVRTNPLRPGTSRSTALGADFKIGLTSDLTITGTVNPDFGQVEADPSQVNLTGGETFFAERRPFFTEGSNLFQYGLTNSDWIFGGEEIFYSRRIGRMPQLEFPDSAIETSAAEPTRLLAAAKLSGRTRGWSVGLLSATTNEERGRYTHTGGVSSHIVEPLTHHGVMRLGRDFEDGASAIGVIGTAVNRELDGTAADFLHSSAYAGGIEGRRRFGGGNYSTSAYVFGSRVAGSNTAIARTQTSFRHLFQRDPERLGLDSSATSLSGVASEVRVMKSGGGRLRWGANAHIVTRGFDVNDLGFINATNFVRQSGWVGRERMEPTRRTRSWSSYVNWWQQRTLGGSGSIAGANWWNGVRFQNQWWLNGVIERTFDGASPTLLRGGPVIRTDGRWYASYRLMSDPRRVVGGALGLDAAPPSDDGSRLTRVWPSMMLRPSPQAEVELTPSMEWRRSGTQFIARPLTASGRRYLVGDLRQRTASLTMRSSYAFTSTLTFQLYAQPFVSNGQYARVGEVARAMSRTVEDRVAFFDPAAIATSADGESVTYPTSGGSVTVDNPDFNFVQLNANTVLRWEYRPGSTLYAVWNQGRTQDGYDGAASVQSGARSLGRAPATNIFLIKWSHYLGR